MHCFQLIAATTLYLAGKVKDDPLKIRDVINVTHNTLHRGSAPLELGDEYWNMRDAIVQAELLIMRMLKFEVTIVHPHKVGGFFHCKNRGEDGLLSCFLFFIKFTDVLVLFL
jgi:hypothetical protein